MAVQQNLVEDLIRNGYNVFAYPKAELAIESEIITPCIARASSSPAVMTGITENAPGKHLKAEQYPQVLEQLYQQQYGMAC